jgi:hypothetical protein
MGGMFTALCLMLNAVLIHELYQLCSPVLALAMLQMWLHWSLMECKCEMWVEG